MQIVEKPQVLTVRMDGAIVVSRGLRLSGFKLQRIERTYWHIFFDGEFFAILHLTLDPTHPVNIVYLAKEWE